MTTGYGTGFSYRWVENRKCGNLAAITILHVVKMHQSIRNYRYRLKKENNAIDIETYQKYSSKAI